MQNDTELVQPIIVYKGGSHERTILSGARASRLAVDLKNVPENLQENLDAWLSGPFVKSVRRGRLKDLAAARDWAIENNIPFSVMEDEASRAVAFFPMKYSELPKEISKLQVSGTELPIGGLPTLTEYSELDDEIKHQISLQVLDSLSTGKATAQAAHAVWKWSLEADADRVEQWLEEHGPATIMFQNSENIKVEPEHFKWYPIVDKGYTEVEEDTLTAYAIDPWE